MSAQQAVQRIQSGWPGTRILLSSGYDEEEVLGSFRGTQLAGFLQKPYTPAQLGEKIRVAMGAPVDSYPAPYAEKPLIRENIASFAA
jgi:CheY-like chemotaxis protein